MSSDKIWGNDEKYSKDFQITMREQCDKQHKLWEAERQQYEAFKTQHIANLPPEQRPGYLTQWAEQQRAQGKILDPFVRTWLENEITTARIALAIGMILTVLIKGQVVIWAIMYVAYRCRVKHATKKAYEVDRRR